MTNFWNECMDYIREEMELQGFDFAGMENADYGQKRIMSFTKHGKLINIPFTVREMPQEEVSEDMRKFAREIVSGIIRGTLFPDENTP